jgi:RND superfamily putative drug exporter
VAEATEAARGVPGVTDVGDPYAGRNGALSEDGHIGFLNVQFDKKASQLDTTQIDAIQDDVKSATDSPVEVELGGPVIDAKQVESGTSEKLGFAAAVGCWCWEPSSPWPCRSSSPSCPSAPACRC